jgi:hypothetical protein
MTHDDERREDAMRLAAETGADPRTVGKWLRGEPVTRTHAYALRAACEKLNIPPPDLGAVDAGAA